MVATESWSRSRCTCPQSCGCPGRRRSVGGFEGPRPLSAGSATIPPASGSSPSATPWSTRPSRWARSSPSSSRLAAAAPGPSTSVKSGLSPAGGVEGRGAARIPRQHRTTRGSTPPTMKRASPGKPPPLEQGERARERRPPLPQWTEHGGEVVRDGFLEVCAFQPPVPPRALEAFAGTGRHPMRARGLPRLVNWTASVRPLALARDGPEACALRARSPCAEGSRAPRERGARRTSRSSARPRTRTRG